MCVRPGTVSEHTHSKVNKHETEVSSSTTNPTWEAKCLFLLFVSFIRCFCVFCRTSKPHQIRLPFKSCDKGWFPLSRPHWILCLDLALSHKPPDPKSMLPVWLCYWVWFNTVLFFCFIIDSIIVFQMSKQKLIPPPPSIDLLIHSLKHHAPENPDPNTYAVCKNPFGKILSKDEWCVGLWNKCN